MEDLELMIVIIVSLYLGERWMTYLDQFLNEVKRGRFHES